MSCLTVQTPEPSGGNEEHAIMETTYHREGKEKGTRTTLSFNDYCGMYPFEIAFKDTDGTQYASFEVEELTVTFCGGYEASDLIKMFRKIVAHHDMQQKVLQGN